MRHGEPAAGTLYLIIDNIGLRPVRVTRVIQVRRRWLAFKPPLDLTQHAHVIRPGTKLDPEFPVVLEPAGEVVIGVNNHLLGRLKGHLGVEDASGRRHWPTARPRRYRTIESDSIFEDRLRIQEDPPG